MQVSDNKNDKTTLVLKIIRGTRYVPFEDILVIKANGNCCDVYHRDSQGNFNVYCHFGLLKELQSELPAYFYRAHRSNVVNMRYTRGVNPVRKSEKLKGIFTEVLNSGKVLAPDKDWTFRVSADRYREFIELRARLK